MEPINPKATNSVVSTGIASSQSVTGGKESLKQKISNPNKTPEFTDLSTRVANSASDVRHEVVANAKKLINDPEWLNDANLENLSGKILGLEDF
tara:strand:+ start:2359 stop:2640 length:282 start_codon:yes stop_codon:yes gene_type:complete